MLKDAGNEVEKVGLHWREGWCVFTNVPKGGKNRVPVQINEVGRGQNLKISTQM